MDNTSPQLPPVTDPSSNSTAMIMHLLQLVIGVFSPLIFLLISKDNPEKWFVTENSKEALNFNITLWAAVIALFIINFVLGMIPILGWILTIPFFIGFIILFIGALALCIIAAVKANEGQVYRYPFVLRLIR